MYVKVVDGIAIESVPKPNYFDSDGNPISDSYLISEESIYPVISSPPSFDDFYQEVNSKNISEWTVGDTQVTETYTISDKPINNIKSDMLDKSTDLRYDYEIGGMIFGSLNIHSSRESQTKILGASQAARNGTRIDDSKWKTIDGFTTISNTDITQLGTDMETFIQACYNKESTLIDSIEAVDTTVYLDAVNSYKSIESTDFTTGWPSNAIFEG